MKRDFYSASLDVFRKASREEILGYLSENSAFPVEIPQKNAWLEEIEILRRVLTKREGFIYFEFAIPRMGKRADVVLLIGPAIFVLEFKVGSDEFTAGALDQVCDYALDLKNFHETSHQCLIAPILIATNAPPIDVTISVTPQNDKLLFPIRGNPDSLPQIIEDVLAYGHNIPNIDPAGWEHGQYRPTPTIIEAALALFRGHSVSEIARNDATAINLGVTSDAISEIVQASRDGGIKSICFVTGVPGAGKTLVGLNTATNHAKDNSLYSVFLSGNGPLVAVLREALARDHVANERAWGRSMKRDEARRKVGAFVQNVHHFRDDCLLDENRPPIEHVAIFDEAQRAWNLDETASFMRRKKNTPNFAYSEPEFLISCLNRHPDWAVVVCLVGAGQEINRGEAGISEWIDSLERSFPDWHIHISSKLTDSEYGAGDVLRKIELRPNVAINNALHLAVSMRSFRAENVSHLIKQLLDSNLEQARLAVETLRKKYPIVITRDLAAAKRWVKRQARGSERYGILVSSQAERLRPHAINVKSPIDPIHWFLDSKEDVRSSYYLEDVATEFHVQGLELDWACVVWDADFRRNDAGWEHWSFVGDAWKNIRKLERRMYQKNCYRVLLTRARQGMAIVVPPGDGNDPTRKPQYYDPTFNYLKEIGFEVI